MTAYRTHRKVFLDELREAGVCRRKLITLMNALRLLVVITLFTVVVWIVVIIIATRTQKPVVGPSVDWSFEP